MRNYALVFIGLNPYDIPFCQPKTAHGRKAVRGFRIYLIPVPSGSDHFFRFQFPEFRLRKAENAAVDRFVAVSQSG